MASTRLTIRIDFGNGTALGPGKVRLLELVDETGSIRRAAAKAGLRHLKPLQALLPGKKGRKSAEKRPNRRSVAKAKPR